MKIEECRSVKNLGVRIDKELKFTDLINRVSKRFQKQLVFVSTLRHFVSKVVTLLHCNLYIKLVIQYGILVYAGTYKTHLNKIASMQRKLLRLVFFKRRTGILCVAQLHVYEIMKFAFRRRDAYRAFEQSILKETEQLIL